jgi:hypothetical protein
MTARAEFARRRAQREDLQTVFISGSAVYHVSRECSGLRDAGQVRETKLFPFGRVWVGNLLADGSPYLMPKRPCMKCCSPLGT